MSMSLVVILVLKGSLDAEALNKNALELNIPIIYQANIDTDKHSGFYPLKFKDQKSGFEIYSVSVKELKRKLPLSKHTDIENGVAYVFSYGHQHNEGASAFYTAAIMTYSQKGIAFDMEGGQYMGVEALLKVAKELAKKH
ncbi:MAG: hypothetical protein COB04_17760 [Gammaproteobacteria bacterium]|nr:MAG: hypothetical protein COB04_17760 [Gammaproteobacteria bacterium]